MQCGFQLLTRTEMVALQHLLDPAVEALDHTVGLRVHRWRRAVFDLQIGAELIAFMLAGGAAFAQTEQAVGEFFPIVGRYRAEPHRAGAFEVALNSTGIGGGLGFIDADEDPARRPVDRHERVTPRRFISHLRHILHVDMQLPWRVSLERLVLGPWRLRLQIAQIARPMAAQAAVQTGA